jgi:hypothetical protein
MSPASPLISSPEDFRQPQEPGYRERGHCATDVGIDVASTGILVNSHRQNQHGDNRHHRIANPVGEVEETTIEGPGSEDPDTVNHFNWYMATGFKRPYPGEKTVRPQSDFNKPAPTTADLDD